MQWCCWFRRNALPRSTGGEGRKLPENLVAPSQGVSGPRNFTSRVAPPGLLCILTLPGYHRQSMDSIQAMNTAGASPNPLRRLDDWDEFVESRYPAPAAKPREDYRNYDN